MERHACRAQHAAYVSRRYVLPISWLPIDRRASQVYQTAIELSASKSSTASEEIVTPDEEFLTARLRMLLMFNEDRIHLPPESHLDQHVISTRDNFLMHHMDHCLHSMRFSRRRSSVGKFGANHQAGEFSGKALVDWLMSVGPLPGTASTPLPTASAAVAGQGAAPRAAGLSFPRLTRLSLRLLRGGESRRRRRLPGEAAAAATAGDAVNRRDAADVRVSLSSRDARDIEDL
uniref:DEP domain-containing protein n=1 Tax=Macrostomum lignano TaxID=282301 RepID=A0A1I8FM68_9PLAT